VFGLVTTGKKNTDVASEWRSAKVGCTIRLRVVFFCVHVLNNKKMTNNKCAPGTVAAACDKVEKCQNTYECPNGERQTCDVCQWTSAEEESRMLDDATEQFHNNPELLNYPGYKYDSESQTYTITEDMCYNPPKLQYATLEKYITKEESDQVCMSSNVCKQCTPNSGSGIGQRCSPTINVMVPPDEPLFDGTAYICAKSGQQLQYGDLNDPSKIISADNCNKNDATCKNTCDNGYTYNYISVNDGPIPTGDDWIPVPVSAEENVASLKSANNLTSDIFHDGNTIYYYRNIISPKYECKQLKDTTAADDNVILEVFTSGTCPPGQTGPCSPACTDFVKAMNGSTDAGTQTQIQQMDEAKNVAQKYFPLVGQAGVPETRYDIWTLLKDNSQPTFTSSSLLLATNAEGEEMSTDDSHTPQTLEFTATSDTIAPYGPTTYVSCCPSDKLGAACTLPAVEAFT
jgi:hypothetical protein